MMSPIDPGNAVWCHLSILNLDENGKTPHQICNWMRRTTCSLTHLIWTWITWMSMTRWSQYQQSPHQIWRTRGDNVNIRWLREILFWLRGGSHDTFSKKADYVISGRFLVRTQRECCHSHPSSYLTKLLIVRPQSRNHSETFLSHFSNKIKNFPKKFRRLRAHLRLYKKKFHASRAC